MRMRSPSSRGFFSPRVSAIDATFALLSPICALFLTDAQILRVDRIDSIVLFCGLSFAFSVLAFLGFRIRDGLSPYFSVTDALDVLKAVIVSELLTNITFFTFSRLEGIPRSAPIVHALVLGAALVFPRLLMRRYHAVKRPADTKKNLPVENIIIIGATHLAAQYIRLLDSLPLRRHRVVGLLDDRHEMSGRSIFGVRVVGLSQHLQPIIDEYSVHGIRIDRVIVGAEPDYLPVEALEHINQICAHKGIDLDFVPSLIGLPELRTAATEETPEDVKSSTPDVALPAYFQFKHAIDIVITLILVAIFWPIFCIACAMAFFDVGSPILFWQQRLGVDGRTFLLYKIRTLRPPFNWRGQPVPDDKRLSWLGVLLRRTRLDEIPQLMNVFIGDMSLIGPRPLLPKDQPEDSAIRLMVRPGLTGWAQVNGGTSLSPAEKNKLDEWYVRNASLWLDLHIILLTAKFLFTGERRHAGSNAGDQSAKNDSLSHKRSPKKTPAAGSDVKTSTIKYRL